MIDRAKMREELEEKFYELSRKGEEMLSEDLNASVNAAYAMIEIYQTLFPEAQNGKTPQERLNKALFLYPKGENLMNRVEIDKKNKVSVNGVRIDKIRDYKIESVAGSLINVILDFDADYVDFVKEIREDSDEIDRRFLLRYAKIGIESEISRIRNFAIDDRFYKAFPELCELSEYRDRIIKALDDGKA